MIDLTNIIELKNYLRKKRIWPNHRLGQNFLIDRDVINKMVTSANVSRDDFILEIGPGVGVLTKALLEKDAHVLAIEKDRELYSLLKESFHQQNFTLKCADALLEIKELDLPQNYKVVSSIPFQISSPLIQLLLTSSRKPEIMVLLLQKEVAERLVAKPGKSARGYLTVLVENYANSEIVNIVGRECFYPEPEVDGAVILIKIKSADQIESEPLFFRFLKAGFAAKRRQIINAFSVNLNIDKAQVAKILAENNIDIKLRAEDLTLKEWHELYKKFRIRIRAK